MSYDIIIGLEIHTEVKTKSKMFCPCPNSSLFEAPNINVCPICLGHPGTLPVPNQLAIEACLLLGLAFNSQINQISKFDRKNYFYPDLPKGYQISQYDLPLVHGGSLYLGSNRSIDITRIHLEEDTGKLSHNDHGSLVDFNRAGAPLIELVTEPTIASASEAKKFCQNYQRVLRYLKVSDADMEKGQMRCEANVSLQIPGTWRYVEGRIDPVDEAQLNAKVEVKNINSFKALEKAINFEIERQSELIKHKKHIDPETRGWNEDLAQTVAQRTKESSADYRYFPEPDIPPLVISDQWLQAIKHKVVELPQTKQERFVTEYGFSENDAETLTTDSDLADFAEAVISELRAWIEASGDDDDRQRIALVKASSGWLTTELFKHLKINDHSIGDIKFSAENLAHLIVLVYQDKINSSAAQIIFNQMYQIGGDPAHIMLDMNLEQNSNEDELETIIKQVLSEYPNQAQEFKSGKTAVMQFLVGKVMSQTNGKANPKLLPDIISKIIN